ncbi:MAG: V-type ATP synthase subunit E family protein [Clostridia bacterium]
MSGIEMITARIIEQAKLQAENRVNYAAETAAKAEEDLKKRFDRTLESEKAKAETEGADAARRVVANSMLEGRKKKLAAMQKAISTVFDKSVERLQVLPRKEYIDFLTNLAVPVLTEGDNILKLNDRDCSEIGSDLVESIEKKAPGMKVSISEECLKSAGGLMVMNGDIQTNLTLESIIRLGRERMEAEVVRILFEREK